jgi:hypothetical protein
LFVELAEEAGMRFRVKGRVEPLFHKPLAHTLHRSHPAVQNLHNLLISAFEAVLACIGQK